MDAVCAICEQPITKSMRFVIAGTEVMHRACARSGRPTVLARLESTLAVMEQEIAAKERILVEAGAAIKRLQDQLRDRGSESRDQRALIDGLRSRESALKNRLEAVQSQIAAVGDPVEVEPVATPDADQKDGTEQRFSLLEFD